MDGEQVQGTNPVTERMETIDNHSETASASNFTPLPERILQTADHAKHRALDAWRRVIHGSMIQKKSQPQDNPQSEAVQTQPKKENKGITRRGFLAGLSGMALGMVMGRGEAQAAPVESVNATKTSEDTAAPVPDKTTVAHNEASLPAGEVHILTAAEYTPENPSPDFLKGQQVGYVQAKETLFDGSKLWPLDWQLSPIHPDDMVYNLPGQRTPASFRAIIGHLNLSHPDNGRYAKVDNTDGSVTTFCNVAASDMADMFQVSHIFSRFDENGTPMLANMMNDRIITESIRKDKEPEVAMVGREEAQKIADLGYPVFLSIKKERKTPNANWMSGHIGLITPRGMLDRKNPEHRKRGIYLTQAGSESGNAIYFDEREKYNEENGYLQPIFALDARDLKAARTKLSTSQDSGPRLAVH